MLSPHQSVQTTNRHATFSIKSDSGQTILTVFRFKYFWLLCYLVSKFYFSLVSECQFIPHLVKTLALSYLIGTGHQYKYGEYGKLKKYVLTLKLWN